MSIFNLFTKKSISSDIIQKDKIAEMLKISPEALRAFEQSYSSILGSDVLPDNFFEVNAKQMASENEGIIDMPYELEEISNRIIEELIMQTPVLEYDGKQLLFHPALSKNPEHPVTNEELKAFPKEIIPQLTGNLMFRDIKDDSYVILMQTYLNFCKEKNPVKKQHLYNMFRQGLDILDIDPITYEMIGTNPNSIGNWFPQLAKAVMQQDFFKLPKTTIIKVPVTMLQLTRCEYQMLTRTTLDIVDKFCQKVFRLDEQKEYFIKTGTYSSKYDFRNAYVHGAKEVRELGEYLLFIHYQALCMAHYDLSGRNQPIRYGVSTTNEWCVREFIKDKENNPCIYKGMPLHTEFRIFVDFDNKKDPIMGLSPYWRPDIMKQRFGHEEDADSPHNVHDYIIYQMYKNTLMERYEKNKDLIITHMRELANDMKNISGQWSVDVMMNGDDFWIIDMALAANSALSDCVPKGLIRRCEENWIPELS